MATVVPSEVTQLLRAWNKGDDSAFDRLIPIVHSELHRLARRYMRDERAGHILQTTALVNEAYMRLIDARPADWQNRAHFFGIAARLMRRILVDFAREREAFSGQRFQPLLGTIRESANRLHRDPQLGLGVDLVDVLPARAAAPRVLKPNGAGSDVNAGQNLFALQRLRRRLAGKLAHGCQSRIGFD